MEHRVRHGVNVVRAAVNEPLSIPTNMVTTLRRRYREPAAQVCKDWRGSGLGACILLGYLGTKEENVMGAKTYRNYGGVDLPPRPARHIPTHRTWLRFPW